MRRGSTGILCASNSTGGGEEGGFAAWYDGSQRGPGKAPRERSQGRRKGGRERTGEGWGEGGQTCKYGPRGQKIVS